MVSGIVPSDRETNSTTGTVYQTLYMYFVNSSLNNENITLLFKLHALSSMIYLGQDISPIIVLINHCSSVISNVSSQLRFYLQNEN